MHCLLVIANCIRPATTDQTSNVKHQQGLLYSKQGMPIPRQVSHGKDRASNKAGQATTAEATQRVASSKNL